LSRRLGGGVRGMVWKLGIESREGSSEEPVENGREGRRVSSSLLPFALLAS